MIDDLKTGILIINHQSEIINQGIDHDSRKQWQLQPLRPNRGAEDHPRCEHGNVVEDDD
jgi:hypothetical protein